MSAPAHPSQLSLCVKRGRQKERQCGALQQYRLYGNTDKPGTGNRTREAGNPRPPHGLCKCHQVFFAKVGNEPNYGIRFGCISLSSTSPVQEVGDDYSKSGGLNSSVQLV